MTKTKEPPVPAAPPIRWRFPTQSGRPQHKANEHTFTVISSGVGSQANSHVDRELVAQFSGQSDARPELQPLLEYRRTVAERPWARQLMASIERLQEIQTNLDESRQLLAEAQADPLCEHAGDRFYEATRNVDDCERMLPHALEAARKAHETAINCLNAEHSAAASEASAALFRRRAEVQDELLTVMSPFLDELSDIAAALSRANMPAPIHQLPPRP